MSGSRRRPPLTATYRVQLNERFTLSDAREIVPYLDRLGVSHLYCSPILAARPGSTHGYDVVDPARVNPALGTSDDLRSLAADLHARGQGLLLDIVPNHMGMSDANPYWEDVLARGRASRYANWFDVDWEAGRNRIVLPVLDDDADVVLARGELSIDKGGAAPRLRYRTASWPIDPASPPHNGDLRALLDAQHYRLIPWRRAEEINYRRFFDINDLVALRQEDPTVFDETHGLVLSLIGEGVADGLRIDHVDGLLDPLGYLTRLRASIDERLRIADCGQPSTDCELRTDLGVEPARSAPRPPPSAHPDFPIFVEKILARGERLRADWPVQGTTGYDFLNDVEDVFIDPAGYGAVERAYRRARRLTVEDFADAAHRGKVNALRGALRADVHRLGRMLSAALAQAGNDDAAQDRDCLEEGIVQFIAALPVYRTYVDARHPNASADDQAVVERAVERARAHAGRDPSLPIVDRIAALVAGRGRDAERAPDERLAFVLRLQQVTGPAAAKGVEDTALYAYLPLASRNEVGGTPDGALDDVVGRFHRANIERARHWPACLLSTNTHDTKRSADVRARLDVLTERPRDWQRCLARWRRLNARHHRLAHGRVAPDGNSEYLLYQSLVGLWPAPRPARRADDLPDRAWRETARERLERYLLKAAREAKVHTTWTSPDAEYERELSAFVAAVLEPAEDAPFLGDLARLVARVAPPGQWNAISRVVLHLTAPGTPDLYRGDELWFLALVDPDNRRAADSQEHSRLLNDLAALEVQPDHGNIAVLAPKPARAPSRPRPNGTRWARRSAAPVDATLKLAVLQRLLHTRRAHAALFRCGDYAALEVAGDRAKHLVAFLRAYGEERVVVLAPRLLDSMGLQTPSELDWGNTRVVLPSGLAARHFRCALTDQAMVVPTVSPSFSASAVLRSLPTAVLMSS